MYVKKIRTLGSFKMAELAPRGRFIPTYGKDEEQIKGLLEPAHSCNGQYNTKQSND